jgi:hypothetical protein
MAIPDDVTDALKAQPYAKVRRLVRNGDLLLCSADDLFSKTIRWATRSPWSHIAIAFRLEPLDRVMVIESVQQIGVRCVPLSNFVKYTSTGQHPYPGRIILARHEDFAHKASKAGMKRLGAFAADRLGDKFAPGELFKIATRVLMGRFERHMPHFLGPHDEFICSEYVGRCFEQVGIEIPWDELGFLAPGDFARDPKVHAVAQIQTK